MSKRSSEDRSSSCAFVFADGRRCRMLRSSLSQYCYHHTRKLHQPRQLEQVLLELTGPVRRGSTCASALAHILYRVSSAVAEGRIPPKQANAIAGAAGALLKSISNSAEPL
jgi:hypothetical protein